MTVAKKVRPTRPRMRIARVGDISDVSVLRGEVGQLRIDMQILMDMIREDIKTRLIQIAAGQQELNVEVTRVLRTLTSMERRLDDHERRLTALEPEQAVNGAAK